MSPWATNTTTNRNNFSQMGCKSPYHIASSGLTDRTSTNTSHLQSICQIRNTGKKYFTMQYFHFIIHTIQTVWNYAPRCQQDKPGKMLLHSRFSDRWSILKRTNISGYCLFILTVTLIQSMSRKIAYIGFATNDIRNILKIQWPADYMPHVRRSWRLSIVKKHWLTNGEYDGFSNKIVDFSWHSPIRMCKLKSIISWTEKNNHSNSIITVTDLGAVPSVTQ